MLKLIVTGLVGRMGGRIAALARDDRRFGLLAGVVRGDEDAHAAHVPVVREEALGGLLARADVLIDFTEPAASVRFAGLAAAARTPVVIGTTGLSARQVGRLRAASRRTAVFFSPNFSPGMTVLFALAQAAAAALPGYDAGIREVHHTAKKDSPSGTALRLAEAAGRPGRRVPVVSQRLGAVVGDHTLTLAGPAERLELTHRAESRDAFARGALDAAAWVAGRKPGLYDMRRMLGI